MNKLNERGEPNRVHILNWDSGEATWCTYRINDADDEYPDIEYVHIDIVNELAWT